MDNLQNAVLTQLGYDELNEGSLKVLLDITVSGAYGADTNYCGFTYMESTSKFYDTNKKAIDALVLSSASRTGGTVIDLVSSESMVSTSKVESFFMGYGGDDDVYIKNALAWFALEDTAHKLTEQ